MAGIPTTLAIGIWAIGACWVVAILAYLFEVETAFVVPLVILGTLTGAIEWLLRRKL